MNGIRHPRAGSALAVLLMLLSVFGPISMDLYLPVLPALTVELDAATSVAQLTITACLLGLGLGQVVAGPISDRFGRRVPLLVGIAAYIVTSALCAVSPSVETLILARFAQGLAGGVGIVIAQAAGRDLYSGSALIRYYGRLTVLGGLAAIVGPLIGGQLARFTDWRGLFLFLAAIGAALLLSALLLFTETLPADRRASGGFIQTLREFRGLLAHRLFLGMVVITGLVNAALFAYLSGATYILQGTYELSPQGYSLAFGLNSLGWMVAGYLGAPAAERWSERGTLIGAIAWAGLGAAGILVTGWLSLPLPVILVSLIVLVSGVAATLPPTTSMGMGEHPDLAGTASSLLGLTRFAVGGFAAPLVGLGGNDAVLPLGIVTTGAVLAAGVAYVTLVRRPAGPAPSPGSLPPVNSTHASPRRAVRPDGDET